MGARPAAASASSASAVPSPPSRSSSDAATSGRSASRSRSAGRRIGQHREAPVEVLAEAAALHRGLQVPVGRRHHPHVQRHGPAAADPVAAPSARSPAAARPAPACESSPTSSRKIVPPAARSKLPARLTASVYAPRSRAEQLGLGEAVGDGAAVDRDEGTGGPVRRAVQRARHELLARAALAEHHHRGVRGARSAARGASRRAWPGSRLRGPSNVSASVALPQPARRASAWAAARRSVPSSSARSQGLAM